MTRTQTAAPSTHSCASKTQTVVIYDYSDRKPKGPSTATPPQPPRAPSSNHNMVKTTPSVHRSHRSTHASRQPYAPASHHSEHASRQPNVPASHHSHHSRPPIKVPPSPPNPPPTQTLALIKSTYDTPAPNLASMTDTWRPTDLATLVPDDSISVASSKRQRQSSTYHAAAPAAAPVAAPEVSAVSRGRSGMRCGAEDGGWGVRRVGTGGRSEGGRSVWTEGGRGWDQEGGYWLVERRPRWASW